MISRCFLGHVLLEEAFWRQRRLKVKRVVELAKQVAKLECELKEQERDMSLEEFISYVSETRETR